MREIPNSQLKVMKDCGHMPEMERPEEFVFVGWCFHRGDAAGKSGPHGLARTHQINTLLTEFCVHDNVAIAVAELEKFACRKRRSPSKSTHAATSQGSTVMPYQILNLQDVELHSRPPAYAPIGVAAERYAHGNVRRS
jgi:hypothetical protein